MRPRLFHSPMSPFVRKVMAAAIETGQLDDIDVVPGDPHGVDAVLRRANAISKIPALTTEDGVDLPESDVICLYLDERAGAGCLIPTAGAARWRTLRRQALADGFMEAAVHRRSEDARPAGARSQREVDRLMERMLRCLDAMADEAGALEQSRNLGSIAVAVACGYADFRYPDLGWRDSRPTLAGFYEKYARRPSMQATIPHDA